MLTVTNKQTASSTPHLLSKSTTYVIMSLYSIPFARPQCCVGSNPEDPSLQAPIRVAPNLPLVPPRNLATSFTTIEDTRTTLKPTISSYIT